MSRVAAVAGGRCSNLSCATRPWVAACALNRHDGVDDFEGYIAYFVLTFEEMRLVGQSLGVDCHQRYGVLQCVASS